MLNNSKAEGVRGRREIAANVNNDRGSVVEDAVNRHGIIAGIVLGEIVNAIA